MEKFFQSDRQKMLSFSFTFHCMQIRVHSGRDHLYSALVLIKYHFNLILNGCVSGGDHFIPKRILFLMVSDRSLLLILFFFFKYDIIIIFTSRFCVILVSFHGILPKLVLMMELSELYSK